MKILVPFASIEIDRVIVAPVTAPGQEIGLIESNLELIKAPDLWALGFAGQGVTVAIMDSGRIIAMDTPRQLILEHGTGLIHVDLEHPVHDHLLETLDRKGAIRRLSERYSGFQFQSPRPNVDLELVLNMAGECRTTVRSAQLLEPTLETVFLNLTGRSVRD